MRYATMHLFKKIAVLSTLALTFAVSVHAKTLSIGDSIELPTLNDQFDQPHTLQANTQWLVLAHDMDSSRVTRDAFEGQTDETLKKANIQYYADISGMPGLISSFIAIPKMQKQKYNIVLAKEDNELAFLPSEDDKVSIFKIENGKIVEFITTDSAEVLKQTVLK